MIYEKKICIVWFLESNEDLKYKINLCICYYIIHL